MAGRVIPKGGDAVTVGCVILAAGNAVRFGANKLLTPFRGKPLVQWALEAIPAEPPGPVAVVTQYDAVAALAARFGFSAVRNEAPELGLSHSVALGTQTLGKDCDGLIFLVADQPLLRRETVAALLDRFRADPSKIVVPAAGERQGNPCVFPAELFPALEALRGDRGGKQLIRQYPERVVTVPAEPAELSDVDTLTDLQKMLYKSHET